MTKDKLKCYVVEIIVNAYDESDALEIIEDALTEDARGAYDYRNVIEIDEDTGVNK